MTANPEYITPHENRKGDCMSGSVQYHPPAKRFYIQVYWEGVRLRVWKHPITLEPWRRGNKQSAEKQLARIQTEIDDGEFNPKFWLPDSPMLIREYAQIWLKVKDVSRKTLSGYRTAVNKYITPFFRDKDIRRIRANDLKLFKMWLEEQLEDKGVYNQVTALKTMFNDAYRNEDITRVPPFPRLRNPEPPPEYITLEQQERLLSAIPERHRPIFQIGMEFGMRVGEVRALKKDCIKDGKIIIKRAFSDNQLKDTKTSEHRERYLTEYAIDVLAGIEPHLSPFVFVRWDGKPYTNKDLNLIWHAAEKETGIKIKLYNAFRHSLGCQLLDMGYSLDHVQDQLGHKNPAMTRRYAKRSNPVLTQALENRRGKIIEIGEKKNG